MERALAHARSLIEQASPHTRDFTAPLPQATVRAFEQREGLMFPKAYRRFVSEISAGAKPTAMGPPHVMTFAEACNEVQREGGSLTRPFPITQTEARRLRLEDARHVEGAVRSVVARDLADGVLPLMDRGGGEMDFLVMTGDERGRMWRAWELGWSPLWRLVGGKPKPHDFLSWLCERLEQD